MTDSAELFNIHVYVSLVIKTTAKRLDKRSGRRLCTTFFSVTFNWKNISSGKYPDSASYAPDGRCM
jgi:hypothetical protein